MSFQTIQQNLSPWFCSSYNQLSICLWDLKNLFYNFGRVENGWSIHDLSTKHGAIMGYNGDRTGIYMHTFWYVPSGVIKHGYK